MNANEIHWVAATSVASRARTHMKNAFDVSVTDMGDRLVEVHADSMLREMERAWVEGFTSACRVHLEMESRGELTRESMSTLHEAAKKANP